MSTQPYNSFEDPVLKEAVKRCWACDCASSHLRKRVAGLLAESAQDSAQPVGSVLKLDQREKGRSIARNPWLIWPLAAAASLAIVLVIHSRPVVNTVASVMPASLENDLIATHDRCCKQKNHQHLAVSIDDNTGIADALRSKLNQPVVMFRPKEAGWQFNGASFCPVGTTTSGHLVFAKGDDAMSVFMLPKSMMPAASEGGVYSATVDQHSIVGFVKDGTLFCLVGSGPQGSVSIAELQQMRSEIEPAVSYAPRVASDVVAVAELLRPVH